MNVTEWISLVKIVLSILVVSGLGVFFIIIYNRNTREKNRIQEFNITANLSIDHTIGEKLDKFISDGLTEYLILNINLLEGNQYINEEMENTIREGFTTFISDRISPIFMQQLSMYYNVDNIYQVLGNKIYIVVTNYVAAMNAPQDDGRDILINRNNLPDYTDMRNSAPIGSNRVAYLDQSINF